MAETGSSAPCDAGDGPKFSTKAYRLYAKVRSGRFRVPGTSVSTIAAKEALAGSAGYGLLYSGSALLINKQWIENAAAHRCWARTSSTAAGTWCRTRPYPPTAARTSTATKAAGSGCLRLTRSDATESRHGARAPSRLQPAIPNRANSNTELGALGRDGLTTARTGSGRRSGSVCICTPRAIWSSTSFCR